MDAVASVRPTLEAGAREAEKTATLPRASVDALYESGLFLLKPPQALGGAEADPVTQLEVLEAVSRIDPASGWCLMIGAASLGSIGAFLPDDAIDQVFVDGKPPRTAGVFLTFWHGCASGRRLPGQWTLALWQRHQACPVGLPQARAW